MAGGSTGEPLTAARCPSPQKAAAGPHSHVFAVCRTSHRSNWRGEQSKTAAPLGAALLPSCASRMASAEACISGSTAVAAGAPGHCPAGARVGGGLEGSIASDVGGERGSYTESPTKFPGGRLTGSGSGGGGGGSEGEIAAELAAEVAGGTAPTRLTRAGLAGAAGAADIAGAAAGAPSAASCAVADHANFFEASPNFSRAALTDAWSVRLDAPRGKNAVQVVRSRSARSASCFASERRLARDAPNHAAATPRGIRNVSAADQACQLALGSPENIIWMGTALKSP